LLRRSSHSLITLYVSAESVTVFAAAVLLKYIVPWSQSNNAKDLIRKMLHPDAGQRLTLAAVRKHPFCAGSVPPVFRALASEMHDKALLTSDDPRDDLYEAGLKKVGCPCVVAACCAL
jgi:serine/threonine protein kinase